MVLLHPLIMQVLSFKLNVGHFPHLADLVTRINYNHFYMSDTGNLRTLPSSENVASRLGKAFLGRTDWWQYDNLCSFHSSWSTVSEVNSFPFEMVVSYGILGCSQINIQDGHQKNSNLKIDSSVSPPHILEGSTIKHLPSNSTVYLYRNGDLLLQIHSCILMKELSGVFYLIKYEQKGSILQVRNQIRKTKSTPEDWFRLDENASNVD